MKRRPVERPRRWASLTTAADYYGCTADTIRNYISAGDIPGYNVGSRRTVKVDLNDLDDLAVRIPSARRAS